MLIIVLAMVLTIGGTNPLIASGVNKEVEEQIPVLLYHRIAPDEDYYHSNSEFEKQLKWLYDNHFNTLSLAEYSDFINGKTAKEALPTNPILITFDDGDVSVYEHAFPILKKYNMKFTLFLIGDSIGEPNFITWEQAREMEQSQLCSVGSHTAGLHNFVLTSSDGSVHGALPSHIWQDDGIYAYENQGQAFEHSSYFSLPIAGTAMDQSSGTLYPIESYLGFYADKTMTVDRVLLRCATHIPAEAYYDMSIKVSIGKKAGAHAITEEKVVNSKWRPKKESTDLYDTVNEDSTWPNGRYDVLYFEKPYTVEAGNWYNLHLVTQEIAEEIKQYRIYASPSLPYEQKNCATNSPNSDYQLVEGWADHHALPVIIASNGYGNLETSADYENRVARDLSRSKEQIQKFISSEYKEELVEPKVTQGQSFVSAIPIFGASNTTVLQKSPGEQKSFALGPFEKMESTFRIEFNKTFQSQSLVIDAAKPFGSQYASLVDIYIGYWNNGNPDGFIKVKTGFSPHDAWQDYYDKGIEIDFDENIKVTFQKDTAYCIKFVTGNYQTDSKGTPIEGVFRMKGDLFSSESGYNAYWNSRAGDGEGDRFVYANVNPYIKFVADTPVNAIYENPTWGLAFPFGMYSAELQDIAYKQGFAVQFSVREPFYNGTTKDHSLELARIGMVKKMAPLEEYLRKFSNIKITVSFPN